MEHIENKRFPLPYYARMKIATRIVEELKGSKERKDINSIYRNIKAEKASKVFGLRLCRFLGLIESDTKSAGLTDLGYRFSMLSEEQKKKILAENLPSIYITFLKWIKDSKDKTMTLEELKGEVLNTFKNWRPSSRVLHEALLTFADVAEYCNMINFIKGGKGSKTRYQLTDFGLQILSTPKTFEQLQPPLPTTEEFVQKTPREEKLSTEAAFPLRIVTRSGKFEFDITHESDWEAVNAIIESLKKKWDISKKDESAIEKEVEEESDEERT
ncbi:MAG: hypothetical protein QW156_05265 [Candidatus Aenigmatarchaeota archaeon]